jgi:hypothetical protein
MHGEFKNLAELIEQGKSYLHPEILAVHGEFKNLANLIEQAKRYVPPEVLAALANHRVEADQAIEVICSESQKTAAALVEHGKNVFSELPSAKRHEYVDFLRFEQILDALRASLEAIQGHQVGIKSNLDVMMLRHSPRKTPDDRSNLEDTMYPEAPPESPSASRRLELREPRATVASARLTDALSTVSDGLAQHRADCRMVWESQDLSCAEMKQMLKDLMVTNSRMMVANSKFEVKKPSLSREPSFGHEAQATAGNA